MIQTKYPQHCPLASKSKTECQPTSFLYHLILLLRLLSLFPTGHAQKPQGYQNQHSNFWSDAKYSPEANCIILTRKMELSVWHQAFHQGESKLLCKAYWIYSAFYGALHSLDLQQCWAREKTRTTCQGNDMSNFWMICCLYGTAALQATILMVLATDLRKVYVVRKYAVEEEW